MISSFIHIDTDNTKSISKCMPNEIGVRYEAVLIAMRTQFEAFKLVMDRVITITNIMPVLVNVVEELFGKRIMKMKRVSSSPCETSSNGPFYENVSTVKGKGAKWSPKSPMCACVLFLSIRVMHRRSYIEVHAGNGLLTSFQCRAQCIVYFFLARFKFSIAFACKNKPPNPRCSRIHTSIHVRILYIQC